MLPGPAGAQTVSVSPFVGYRFGGDLYEELTATQLDLDGAPSVGVVLDVFTGRDVAVTFLYSHQEAVVDVPRATGPPARTVIAVDHWHGGSTQDFDFGRVRPFVDGSLGLTRFYGGGDSETRFSLGGGGGVKLLAAAKPRRAPGRARLRRLRRRRRQQHDLLTWRLHHRPASAGALAGGLHGRGGRLVLSRVGTLAAIVSAAKVRIRRRPQGTSAAGTAGVMTASLPNASSPSTGLLTR